MKTSSKFGRGCRLLFLLVAFMASGCASDFDQKWRARDAECMAKSGLSQVMCRGNALPKKVIHFPFIGLIAGFGALAMARARRAEQLRTSSAQGRDVENTSQRPTHQVKSVYRCTGCGLVWNIAFPLFILGNSHWALQISFASFCVLVMARLALLYCLFSIFNVILIASDKEMSMDTLFMRSQLTRSDLIQSVKDWIRPQMKVGVFVTLLYTFLLIVPMKFHGYSDRWI